MCQTDTNAIFRVIGWACYACHGSRYRLCGTRGCAETNPTTHELRIQYNPWTRPEGVEKNVVEYKAEWPDNELGKLADNSGHDGGDFWAIYFFVKAMEAGEEPFFNVYRATTIASVAILAWRSILNDNKCYDVPDFRKEEDRKKYENDNISPYPDENYCVNIPCSSQPYAPSEEDIENARRFWQNADYLHE